MKALVIYHADCVDGFGAAWAFHTLKSKDYDSTSYLPANYGDSSPDPDKLDKGTDVWILDFSYPRDILNCICDDSNLVVVLDHHKTAQEALENWEDKPENLKITFDMNQSGAGLTWRTLDTISVPPLLIQYIEDRDIWAWKLYGSKEVSEVIALTPKDFRAYTQLSITLGSHQARVMDIGEHLLAQRERYIHEFLKLARPIKILEHSGLCCNVPHQFSSELGTKLAERSGTFGATYYTDAEGSTRFSLRSLKGFDVSAIAKAFGGGGHAQAAGFTIVNPRESEEGINLWLTEEGLKEILE